MPPLQAFNLHCWIDRNRPSLRPPIGNKRIFLDGDLIIMVVGGPNTRKDYHVDPGQEFFYQLEGDMVLRTIEQERRVDVTIREGEVLLIPPRLPHSTQRGANTIGLVIERRRQPEEFDGFQWFCERCDRLLHEEFFALADIEQQFQAILSSFYASPERRTCATCKAVLEEPTVHIAGSIV